MTLEELKSRLREDGYEGTIVLENPDYAEAAVGVTNNGKVVYDFERMVEHLASVDGITYEDAVEFIEYNTLRAIPYFGEKAPIVMFRFGEI